MNPTALFSRSLGWLALLAPVLALTAVAAEPSTSSATLLGRSGNLRVSIDAAAPTVAELPDGVRIDRSAAIDDGFIAAGTENSHRLVVLQSDGERTWSLPSPRVPANRSGDTSVAEPLPIVRDGRLLGLAWLDGANRGSYAVRFAAWDGDRWRATETVAPRGSGSQIALAATVLADDSILLAWSAFDGTDDEIVWSHRIGSGWSPPALVAPDNQVPDVVPALATYGDRAVIAWSRFDEGQYRLVTAAFSPAGANGIAGFDRPRPAAGPGSLFPEFHPSNGPPVLSFRDASSGTWAVIRLEVPGDRASGPTIATRAPGTAGRITLIGTPAERPRIVGADDAGVVLFEHGSDRPTRLPWEPEL